VALSSARCCVLFVCLLVAVPSLTQDIDRLAHTVVFLYRTEQRPVVKDGKRGMETDTEFGTGFLFTPDDKTMFFVTANHVASIMKPDFRATVRGDNDTPLDMSSEDLIGTKNVIWVSHDTEDVAVALLHPSDCARPKIVEHFLSAKQLKSDNTGDRCIKCCCEACTCACRQKRSAFTLVAPEHSSDQLRKACPHLHGGTLAAQCQACAQSKQASQEFDRDHTQRTA
jgi:hypothetical protein